jgi:metallo-beta-lactamase family protein
VIESTYGDRLHEDRKQRRWRLKAIIEQCLVNKGTVLIPAFSIGRTQELLYELEDLISGLDSDLDGGLDSGSDGGLMSEIDVIVDSPLASEFTKHYRKLKHLWDAEAKQRLADGRHPLSFDHLLTVNSHAEHVKLVAHLKDSGRPAIVIAASGMCAGGRMQNYLKALLPDERTDVIFVGYQAKGTPGRDIQRYGPRFKQGDGLGYVVFADDASPEPVRIDIRAGIYTLGGYSAHADQQDLINFVAGMDRKPATIRSVHGDDKAKQALKEKYQSLFGCEVVIP